MRKHKLVNFKGTFVCPVDDTDLIVDMRWTSEVELVLVCPRCGSNWSFIDKPSIIECDGV